MNKVAERASDDSIRVRKGEELKIPKGKYDFDKLLILNTGATLKIGDIVFRRDEKSSPLIIRPNFFTGQVISF